MSTGALCPSAPGQEEAVTSAEPGPGRVLLPHLDLPPALHLVQFVCRIRARVAVLKG